MSSDPHIVNRRSRKVVETPRNLRWHMNLMNNSQMSSRCLHSRNDLFKKKRNLTCFGQPHLLWSLFFFLLWEQVTISKRKDLRRCTGSACPPLVIGRWILSSLSMKPESKVWNLKSQRHLPLSVTKTIHRDYFGEPSFILEQCTDRKEKWKRKRNENHRD